MDGLIDATVDLLMGAWMNVFVVVLVEVLVHAFIDPLMAVLIGGRMQTFGVGSQKVTEGASGWIIRTGMLGLSIRESTVTQYR